MGMTPTKTRKEYYAMAMLLGYNYDPRINTFYDHHKLVGHELDADTMEQVWGGELSARFEKAASHSITPEVTDDT